MKIKYDADEVTKHVELEGEKINPCPFCGSGNIELHNTHTPTYWMECQGCGARATGQSFNVYGDSEDSHLAAAQSALTAWNRRVRV